MLLIPAVASFSAAVLGGWCLIMIKSQLNLLILAVVDGSILSSILLCSKQVRVCVRVCVPRHNIQFNRLCLCVSLPECLGACVDVSACDCRRVCLFLCSRTRLLHLQEVRAGPISRAPHWVRCYDGGSRWPYVSIVVIMSAFLFVRLV